MGSWLNKPNRQTVIPERSIHKLFKDVKLQKVRNLGGKVGTTLIEELGLNTMADLSRVPLTRLQERFGVKLGTSLFDLGQGIDNEAVRPRQFQKSIACSKYFYGKNALATRQELQNKLLLLAKEVHERLAEEKVETKRIAQLMTLHVQQLKSTKNGSRSFPVLTYDIKKFYEDSLKVLLKEGILTSNEVIIQPPIVLLGLSASKFIDQETSSGPSIKSFLIHGKSTCTSNRSYASGSSAVPNNKSELSVVAEKSTPFCAANTETASSSAKLVNSANSTQEGTACDDTVVCDDCGNLISVWDLPEHSDYHVALKMQNEQLYDKTQVNVPHSRTKVQQQTKRKCVPPPRKKFRPIDTFFSHEKK